MSESAWTGTPRAATIVRELKAHTLVRLGESSRDTLVRLG